MHAGRANATGAEHFLESMLVHADAAENYVQDLFRCMYNAADHMVPSALFKAVLYMYV